MTMSGNAITGERWAECDRCTRWTERVDNRQDLEELMRIEGWRIEPRVHLCPDCARDVRVK